MSRRASAPSSAPRPPRPAGHKGKSGKHGQQIPGSDPTRRNDQGPFRPKRLVRLWLLQDRCDVRPNDAPARAYYREIAKPSVSFHQKAITSIDPTTRKVSTDQGRYQADVLAAALGADRSTSRGGTGGWSPRRRMQLTSAPDGSTEPTTFARGRRNVVPMHPPKKPMQEQALPTRPQPPKPRSCRIKWPDA
jgi:hypothetical protein